MTPVEALRRSSTPGPAWSTSVGIELINIMNGYTPPYAAGLADIARLDRSIPFV